MNEVEQQVLPSLYPLPTHLHISIRLFKTGGGNSERTSKKLVKPLPAKEVKQNLQVDR